MKPGYHDLSHRQGPKLFSLFKLYTYVKHACPIQYYSPKQNKCVTFDVTGQSDLIHGIWKKYLWLRIFPVSVQTNFTLWL
jgi:hypothetical protein